MAALASRLHSSLALILASGALALGCGSSGSSSSTPPPPATSSCTDTTKNGAETDIDCGGGCTGCAVGKACLLGTDCSSKLCVNGACADVPATCQDKAKNGTETDVDCGGTQCPACADGKVCSGKTDCTSGVCSSGKCQASSCTDSVKNGDESDQDCGGSKCPKCGMGKTCKTTVDCENGLCLDGACAPAACGDKLKNGQETDVDCGGTECPKCADTKGCSANSDCDSGVCTSGKCEAAGCTDKVKNGAETDVDCGGATCPKCETGKTCSKTSDCEVGICLDSACAPAACMDGIKNGAETDVDCGGPSCLPCGNDKGCSTNTDCVGGVCYNNLCQAASCTDVVKNADETDVDCGGATCPKCETGQGCAKNTDCQVGLCLGGVCAPVSCADKLTNGLETDTDCGGPDCPPCADGLICSSYTDCKSSVCVSGLCAAATCGDSVKNGTETGIDCGGSCPGCPAGSPCEKTSDCVASVCIDGSCAPAACGDGIKNGNETDVDCGGSDCQACGTGKGCAANEDCEAGVCNEGVCQQASCSDTIKNGTETDVDCGGGCPGCVEGLVCSNGSDCASGLCFNKICVSPGCGDKIKNADETDVDCGGSCPLGCADGKVCIVHDDCQNGVCDQGICQPPTCTDGLANGQETGIDCGGPICPKCPDSTGCKTGSDCTSGICVNSQCQQPSCADKVKNGNETDVDCGGLCPACGPTRPCTVDGDCWDGKCVNGTCGGDATVVVGSGGTPFDPNTDGSKLVVVENGAVTVDRATSLMNIARYIYVSNSGEGTISKIDPNTQKEVARYCTAPGCNADPSRASVSLDGDVGVANRANYFYSSVVHPERASAVKIAGDLSRCVDRNGNGKIDTFQGEGAVPTQFRWPANTTVSPDECVLWYTPLVKDRNGSITAGAGTLPRSATWDSKSSANGSLSSNFYVGLYGTSELVQIDAATGQIKQQVAVGGMPYSSVFDRFGFLWIRDASSNRLIRVDTNQASLPAVFVGAAIPCGYAITADRRGYVYAAGGNCVTRIDPNASTPTWETLALPGASSTRGPSLDSDFNLWVPDTFYGAFHVDASKPVGQGMTLKKAIPLAANSSAYILGTAIDNAARAWIINTETGNLQQVGGPAGTVYRIDWQNNYAITQLRVGSSPYVYSDLSGSQLALTAPTIGSYRKNFTAWCGNKATFTKLSWTDTLPSGTSVQVRYRAAKDLYALQTAPFVTVGTEPPVITQPIDIALPQGTDTSIFQVEFVIATSDTANKPALTSVSVDYSCPSQP